MSSRTRRVVLLTVLVSLVAPSLAWADAYIFWGEFSGGLIRRANIDGSGVTTIATDQTNVWGLAADKIHERIYWTTLGTALRGINFDGTGLPTDVQTLVATGEGIAVNPTTQNVYFNYYTPTSTPNAVGNGIDYAKGDGSETPFAAHHLYDQPIGGDTGLALDVAGGTIYEHKGVNIYKGPLDGSGAMVAMGNVTTDNSFGIALDLINRKMYWTTYLNDNIGWIKSANMDGTEGTSIVASGLGTSVGIALDAASGTIYFGLDGNSTYGRGIYSIPTTGGTPTQLIALSNFPRGLAIAVPEPASFSLLAIGGLLALRRRC